MVTTEDPPFLKGSPWLKKPPLVQPEATLPTRPLLEVWRPCAPWWTNCGPFWGGIFICDGGMIPRKSKKYRKFMAIDQSGWLHPCHLTIKARYLLPSSSRKKNLYLIPPTRNIYLETKGPKIANVCVFIQVSCLGGWRFFSGDRRDLGVHPSISLVFKNPLPGAPLRPADLAQKLQSAWSTWPMCRGVFHVFPAKLPHGDPTPGW